MREVVVNAIPPLTSKPESLGQMVYDAIRDAIVEQLIPPGSPVSEAELARQLGVSKTPVREALLRLQTIGLVEPAGPRGARVVLPSDELLRHAYEVRAALESGVARLAAAHATGEQTEAIVDAARRSMECAEREEITGFQEWDRRFHRLTAGACDNARLVELVDNAATLARILRDRDGPTPGDAMRCAQHHIDIAAAIERGDRRRAADSASQHVDFVYQMVLEARHVKHGAADGLAPAATTVGSR